MMPNYIKTQIPKFTPQRSFPNFKTDIFNYSPKNKFLVRTNTTNNTPLNFENYNTGINIIQENLKNDCTDTLKKFIKHGLVLNNYKHYFFSHACKNGLINIMKEYYPIYFPNIDETELLQIAINNKNYDIVRYLLDFACDRLEDKTFNFVAKFAIENDLKEILDIVLSYKNKISLNYGFYVGEAVLFQRNEMIQTILNKYDHFYLSRKKFILSASENNNFEHVILLTSRYKYSTYILSLALRYACINNNLEMVTFLFNKGALLNITIDDTLYVNNTHDHPNDSAILSAIQAKIISKDLVTYLIGNGCEFRKYEYELLLKAVECGNIDLIEYLISKDVNIAKYPRILTLSFINNQKNMYEYLIKFKPKDFDFKETITKMLERNCVKIDSIKYIFDHYCQDDYCQNDYCQNDYCQDDYCQHTFLLACFEGRTVIVKYLIENYFDSIKNILDEALLKTFYGFYPRFEIVKLLLELGADINISNGYPLNRAFIEFPKLFKYLICKNADISLLQNETARNLLLNRDSNDSIFKILYDGSSEESSEESSEDCGTMPGHKMMDVYERLRYAYPYGYREYGVRLVDRGEDEKDEDEIH